MHHQCDFAKLLVNNFANVQFYHQRVVKIWLNEINNYWHKTYSEFFTISKILISCEDTIFIIPNASLFYFYDIQLFAVRVMEFYLWTVCVQVTLEIIIITK